MHHNIHIRDVRHKLYIFRCAIEQQLTVHIADSGGVALLRVGYIRVVTSAITFLYKEEFLPLVSC